MELRGQRSSAGSASEAAAAAAARAVAIVGSRAAQGAHAVSGMRWRVWPCFGRRTSGPCALDDARGASARCGRLRFRVQRRQSAKLWARGVCSRAGGAVWRQCTLAGLGGSSSRAGRSCFGRCDSEGERQQRRSSRWCSLALGRHQKRRGAGVQAKSNNVHCGAGLSSTRSGSSRQQRSWGESLWETSRTEGEILGPLRRTRRVLGRPARGGCTPRCRRWRTVAVGVLVVVVLAVWV